MTPNEYNQVVDIHADNIYRFIVKNLKDAEKAKDIVQESFERLWMNKKNVELKR